MKWGGNWTVWALSVYLSVTVGCANSSINKITKRFQTQPAAKSFDSEISLARLSERHGKLENAETIYKAIVELDPKHPVANHRLGVLAAQNRDFQTAQRYFETAQASGNTNSELLSDIGYYLYLRNDLPAAEAKLREAVAMDSRNNAARTNLGLVIGEQGRFDEALQEFQRVGTQAEAHANLAYVFSLLGDTHAAAQQYNRALSLDPNLKTAGEALAQLASHQRERSFRHSPSNRERQQPPQDAIANSERGDRSRDTRADFKQSRPANEQIAALDSNVVDLPATLELPSTAPKQNASSQQDHSRDEGISGESVAQSGPDRGQIGGFSQAAPAAANQPIDSETVVEKFEAVKQLLAESPLPPPLRNDEMVFDPFAPSPVERIENRNQTRPHDTPPASTAQVAQPKLRKSDAPTLLPVNTTRSTAVQIATKAMPHQSNAPPKNAAPANGSPANENLAASTRAKAAPTKTLSPAATPKPAAMASVPQASIADNEPRPLQVQPTSSPNIQTSPNHFATRPHPSEPLRPETNFSTPQYPSTFTPGSEVAQMRIPLTTPKPQTPEMNVATVYGQPLNDSPFSNGIQTIGYNNIPLPNPTLPTAPTPSQGFSATVEGQADLPQNYGHASVPQTYQPQVTRPLTNQPSFNRPPTAQPPSNLPPITRAHSAFPISNPWIPNPPAANLPSNLPPIVTPADLLR